MAKKKAREARADVKESARRIWLAGLGALAVAEDEGSKLFKGLLKKGESYEADNKARAAKLLPEPIEGRSWCFTASFVRSSPNGIEPRR